MPYVDYLRPIIADADTGYLALIHPLRRIAHALSVTVGPLLS